MTSMPAAASRYRAGRRTPARRSATATLAAGPARYNRGQHQVSDPRAAPRQVGSDGGRIQPQPVPSGLDYLVKDPQLQRGATRHETRLRIEREHGAGRRRLPRSAACERISR